MFQWNLLHAQYTAGITPDDALRYAHSLNKQGFRALLNSLGEKADSSTAAEKKTQQYAHLLEAIAEQRVDASISVKLSDLGLRRCSSTAKKNLITLLSMARELKRIIEIDMEYRALVEPTIDLAKQMLRQGFEFRLAMQSGLTSALPLANELINMARQFSGNIGFRIVTGSCYANGLNGYHTSLETSELTLLRSSMPCLSLRRSGKRKGG